MAGPDGAKQAEQGRQGRSEGRQPGFLVMFFAVTS